MKIYFSDWKTFVVERYYGQCHSTLEITWYKLSECLYLFTGLMPEKFYDFLDKIRWKLEKIGW